MLQTNTTSSGNSVIVETQCQQERQRFESDFLLWALILNCVFRAESFGQMLMRQSSFTNVDFNDDWPLSDNLSTSTETGTRKKMNFRWAPFSQKQKFPQIFSRRYFIIWCLAKFQQFILWSCAFAFVLAKATVSSLFNKDVALFFLVLDQDSAITENSLCTWSRGSGNGRQFLCRLASFGFKPRMAGWEELTFALCFAKLQGSISYHIALSSRIIIPHFWQINKSY